MPPRALHIRLEEGQGLLAPPCSIDKGGEKMRFATCAGWDYSSIIAVLKLDGSPAVEGKDCHFYRDGNKIFVNQVWTGWEADSIETGVDLKEGIVIYRVPSLYHDPATVWKAIVRNDRLVADKPIDS